MNHRNIELYLIILQITFLFLKQTKTLSSVLCGDFTLPKRVKKIFKKKNKEGETERPSNNARIEGGLVGLGQSH